MNSRVEMHIILQHYTSYYNGLKSGRQRYFGFHSPRPTLGRNQVPQIGITYGFDIPMGFYPVGKLNSISLARDKIMNKKFCGFCIAPTYHERRYEFCFSIHRNACPDISVIKDILKLL